MWFPDGRVLTFDPQHSDIRPLTDETHKLAHTVILSHGKWTGKTPEREREREMDMELCTCNHWNLTVAIVVMLLPLVLITNKILALFLAVYP